MLQVMQQVVESDVTLQTDDEERAVIPVTIGTTVGSGQSQEYVGVVVYVDIIRNCAGFSCCSHEYKVSLSYGTSNSFINVRGVCMYVKS